MLQKPNTVFVGKKINEAGTTLVAGDIVAINGETGAVIATSDITTLASAPKSIQLGYVKATGSTDADATIVKTQKIGRKNITNIKYADDVAKSEAVINIDWTAAAIVLGKRYVVRVIYRDIYEHPGQFTHTYEVVAASADVAAANAAKDSIIDKFVAKINAHTGRRVLASKQATDVLRLTALPVNGPEAGIATKEAISPYSQVHMKAVVYFTDNSSISNNQYQAVDGLTIATTESKPGKGNPFVVRDREQAALGYKGITYRTEWPVIKPELTVELDKTYDTMIIEFTNQYQSPDNQYVKSTDLAAEVYVVAGTELTALNDLIVAWASLVGPEGAAA